MLKLFNFFRVGITEEEWQKKEKILVKEINENMQKELKLQILSVKNEICESMQDLIKNQIEKDKY